MSALARMKDEVGYEQLLYDDQIGKVSLVGVGMRSHPGVSARFFSALADAGVNIEMISTSEIRISVVVRREPGGRRRDRGAHCIRPGRRARPRLSCTEELDGDRCERLDNETEDRTACHRWRWSVRPAPSAR